MTNKELRREFDIHYNSIAGMSAPSLDNYEVSVYLTKAQLELVKDCYDPSSNKKRKGFENSEKRRNDLKELVVDFKTNLPITNPKAITSESKFFLIPNNVFLIVYENATLSSTNICLDKKIIDVKPVTHDEYNTQRKNPFKKPDSSIAWRLDISKIGNDKIVELVNPNTISDYHLRYIKYPNPIILEDLSTAFPSETLTIDGISVETQCELSTEIQREIIDRAVELALVDYKPQNLASKVELDQRNE